MKRTTPTTFIEAIDLWPKRAALARLLHTPEEPVTAAAVRAWHSRNSIPEPYWMRVSEVATRCGFEGVTYALLSSFTPGF
jgi:hypothetical protein